MKVLAERPLCGCGSLPKFEHVDGREVQRAIFPGGQLEEIVLIAELRGDLVGNETAVGVHCHRDGPQQLVLGLWLDDEERQARHNVVTVRVTHFAQRVEQIQGVGVQDRHPRVPEKLLSQMRDKLLVEFEEDQLRLAVHASDNLAGMATFSGAEFDHDARPGKINASRGLPCQERRTGHNVTDTQRIGEGALKEQKAHSESLD
jgi:hypothetical protein